MSSYYKCKLFEEKIEDYKNFSYIQEELLLKNFNGNSSSFEKINVEYVCSFEEKEGSDWSKPTGIICIKDNTKLLKFTLENLKQYNVYSYVNFIIVDDRSTEDIKTICNKYPVSYLRVDNKKGFNFSSLNNIAAKIANDKGSTKIILWNSDLWTPDETTIPKLLELHDTNDATISGTRLLYPPFSWNGEEVSENIKEFFINKSFSYRDTVQFGGSFFSYNDQLKSYIPKHYGRFCEKNNPYVTNNKIQEFITGAFLIIDLKWFITIGGLNPSLSKNFQDVDLCFKSCEQNKKNFYFGNVFLYHDESLTLTGQKNDKQITSDMVLYSKLWEINKFNNVIYKLG